MFNPPQEPLVQKLIMVLVGKKGPDPQKSGLLDS